MTKFEKQTGNFESFDGTSIYFESRGQGEPIIFVYGIACLINHWHYQIDFFSENYRTIAFDIRGHHHSQIPKDLNSLNISSIAKDVQCLMEHLGLKKAHLVGHSFGVPVLLSFSEQFPTMVASLSFINGFAKNPIKGMFGLDLVDKLFYFIKQQYHSNPQLWNQLWRSAVHNPLSSWIAALAGGFNLKLTQFKDIEIYTKGVAQIPLEVFLPFFEDMMEFQGDQLTGQIKAPTLIVAGDKDLVTPLKFQKQLHEDVSSSELVIVPYGSHCTQLDFPDYVNLRLEKHFTSHRLPKS